MDAGMRRVPEAKRILIFPDGGLGFHIFYSVGICAQVTGIEPLYSPAPHWWKVSMLSSLRRMIPRLSAHS